IAKDWETVKGQRESIAAVILRFGIRASLTVPVMANGRRIGGLSVASSEPRAWTQEEITLVEAVGRQIGAAAERLRLLEEVQAHADLMGRLASLGDPLNRPLAVKDVIPAIGQGALMLSGADRAAVYLHNPDHTITCVWSHGLSQAYRDQVAARIQELPGRVLLQEPKPVLIPDVMALPPGSPIRDLAQAEGFRAYAVWPLAYEGRTIAGIACYYNAPHTWSEAEQEAMETFARQAAIALENARLYSSLQETNEQLQKALQAKEEMIQNVSHELRTPLTLIQGYVELLKDGYLGSLSPQQAEAVHSIHANSRRLHFMIHRLLTLQTLAPERFQYTSMSPISWLKDTAERWRQQAEEAGIRLSLDLPPTLPFIKGDPELLFQVMDNLIDNAIKFSPEGGEIRIRARQEGDELIISISDQGIGLSPEELPHVFERFYQADGGTTRRFGGMGIGLTLCKAIIEGHGGRIWAQSEGMGKGSTFYISLPFRDLRASGQQDGG
ncbi:MAG TPA: GAF domain-containing protein, partial [Caldilineae bacterium]|nr:GAF domain-containing protein [Caldilineae bacterium]